MKNFPPQRALWLTAWIAGLFCALICAVMVYEHFAAATEDPWKSPQLLALKEKLANDPKNEPLQKEIRQLDLQFRQKFRRRLALGEPVTYLTEEPAAMGLTSSDPIPTPAAGEVNWAQAGRGAKAGASSVYDSGGGPWGPAGIIDGRSDKQDWGHGHGWASRRGQALPQWVEIQFPAPHDISRLVVITYHGDAPGDTAEFWGVTDYHIQVWDEAASDWKTVVEEDRARAMKTRVHPLQHPVRTTKFRIVITHVAADDNVARLLQLEAWGAK